MYHPCAPAEHVAKLRELARGCLQKHILTPYPKLTKEEVSVCVGGGHGAHSCLVALTCH